MFKGACNQRAPSDTRTFDTQFVADQKSCIQTVWVVRILTAVGISTWISTCMVYILLLLKTYSP